MKQDHDSSVFDVEAKDTGQPSVDGLIARLEAATEGDRELDADIAAAVLPGEIVWKQTRFTGDMLPVRRFPTAASLSGWASEPVEHYTTSIDAALTLVPEGMDWSAVRRTRHPYCGQFPYEAVVWNVRVQGFAHSAPLAVCIAALKARQIVPQTGLGTPGEASNTDSYPHTTTAPTGESDG